jgi:hypothetical protein
MSSGEFGLTLPALAGVPAAATVAATVVAATPASTVRRVSVPAGSSSALLDAIECSCGASLMTVAPRSRSVGVRAQRAFSSMKVKSD